VERARIRVVHSAIDVAALRREASGSDAAELRRSLEVPDGAPVIGFAAAFSPQKGHAVLLDAAPAILAECPGAVFLLPGEGATRPDAIRTVEGRGLAGAFRFPGFRADVAALTALCTVGVVPSVDGEGSSASIKEPLALGVPVVASDLPGNLEVLGDAGLSFRNRDPATLAAAVVRLLKDPPLRERLAERGAARAEAFAPAGMARGVLAAYRELERDGNEAGARGGSRRGGSRS
jgi:glycosyltransferase involved in cell wall biosynthesis